MIYFVRTRAYFSYLQSLWQEIKEGKRELTPKLASEIFLLGLKALYSLEMVTAQELKPSLDDLIQTITPKVGTELKNVILKIKDKLERQEEGSNSFAELKTDLESFLKLVKKELEPIL